MHPAYSVILFTTASGAGYGLAFWLVMLALFDDIPAEPRLGITGFGLAFALITIGLLSSTAHLGRPLRAWRAFSQWRSSWLSREGVAAMATFVPMAAYAGGWIVLGQNKGWFAVAGLLLAAMCVVTVWCTGMIYQSLPTIRAWHQGIVAPVYVALALASGAVLALLLLRLFNYEAEDFGWVTVAVIAAALLMKRVYWAFVDAPSEKPLTAGQATGLGRFGAVRVLEAPHTQSNFVMREMGYQVARKHSARLRLIVQAFGFVLPIVLLIATLTVAGPTLLVGTIAAVASAAFGVVVERWLFFAEARHVVTLFYGGDTI